MSENIFDSYDEVRRHEYWTEINKTKRKLLIISVVYLLSSMLGLLIQDLFSFEMFLWILVVPAIVGGLAFLALKEPLAAVILATIVIFALWIYQISLMGTRGILSGFLVKAILIYLLIAAFQSARQAQRIKREIVNP